MRDKRIVVPVTQEEREISIAMAKEKHFDSVAAWVRHLMREAWAREKS